MSGQGPRIFTLEGDAPDIHGGAWAAPGAVLIGRVRLLDQSSVWFNVVARGDNEWITVGEGSNIQDGSVMHTDVGCPLDVGAGVTVGHKVMLHGCRISDNVLVGMGSTVLNRAVVGENTIIGAGSLVAEGKEIPPGVLALGVPARPIRDLKEQELQLIKYSAEHYIANAERYRKGLSGPA